MKTKNTVRNSQAGFSLIELMVVVAIIGILAAIGIPQYAKFQAKARQSEAKSALSVLYSSEQSFLGEWNQYTINLKNAGFGVQGSNLRYITGFSQTACTGYVTSPAPSETNAGSTGGTATENLSNDVDVSPITIATWLNTPTAPTTGASDCTLTTFIGRSYGSPLNTPVLTAGGVDNWTINQLKVIAQPQPGI